jgi:glc operon protein GlcG
MQRSIFAAAFFAAIVVAGGAHAQVPPDPNNPNENVPEQLNTVPYGEPINLATAKKVAAGAVAEMEKRHWQGLCIAIAGPSGDLVYSSGTTNANLARSRSRSTRRGRRRATGARHWCSND